MNNASQSKSVRKTPANASELEREQLKFFLSQGDLAATLSRLNPSLAWLPILAQMQLIKSERQLAGWIEQNFGDAQSVTDVVANLRFFGPETADILEFRLDRQTDQISPALEKSWRLVIRHMRTAKQGHLRPNWFDIAPRIRRGEASAEILERLVEVLTPKLRVGPRLSLTEEDSSTIEEVSQLMSIDYEIDEGVTAEEVLTAWPQDNSAQLDGNLLERLTAALGRALEDAADAGVERETFSASDLDVPSVAAHPQNQFRTGFQAIVLVMAGLWDRLATKASPLAVRFVEDWRRRPQRLMRRLALFASANPIVPSDLAADVLISVPLGEFFLSGASVEVIRLLRARWGAFEPEKQRTILSRIRSGPPRDWYREDADFDTYLDRTRFDVLAEMQRDSLFLDEESKHLLGEICARHSKWSLRRPEQAGFHIWSEGIRGPLGDPEKLAGLPDRELVSEAERLASASTFMDGDAWQALCQSEPDRALHGLQVAASAGRWPVELWRQFLWTPREYAERDSEPCVAELLLTWPVDTFDDIAPSAAWWLRGHTKTLPDGLLWPLWDKVADAVLKGTEGATHA